MELVRSTSQQQAVEHAASFLHEQLLEQKGRPTTLLLSGGSAELIYQRLSSLPWPDDLSWLQVGQVDERWGKRDHATSNQLLIKNSGLVEKWEQHGVSFFWVLEDSSEPSRVAQAYEGWLRERFSSSFVMAVIGIGNDGHTAGILPFSDQMAFERTFPNDRFFVSYTAPVATEFPERLTLTPSALLECDRITGVMWGAAKEPVWHQLAQPPFPSLAEFPAQILHGISGEVWYGK